MTDGNDPNEASGPNSARRELPPSEPRPRSSLTNEHLSSMVEQPARLQMAAALTLGLVLVAIPLYFWRRPRTVVPQVATGGAMFDAGADAAGGPDDGGAIVDHDAGSLSVTLAPPRVLECHDSGPRRTAPADCDHLPAMEAALANAVLGSASCFPAARGEGGTIEYVLDVSFARKRSPFLVTAPRDGRTVKNVRTVAACVAAVKRALTGTSLEVPHQHGRYKISVTASYPAH